MKTNRRNHAVHLQVSKPMVWNLVSCEVSFERVSGTEFVHQAGYRLGKSGDVRVISVTGANGKHCAAAGI
jgi:hypothetical protein